MLMSTIQELFSLLLVHSRWFYCHVYSLDFNPCENIFSMTKSWIGSNDVIWRLRDEPERMVQQVVLNFTVKDVINYMVHTGCM